MKNQITYIFLLITLILHAQDYQYEVIDVNSNSNVFLFFPSTITKGLPGSNNFKFSYNKQEAENFGIVKGTKGPKSSLHVFTKDGKVYTFILRYNPDIKQFNHFIGNSDALGYLDSLKKKQAVSTGQNIGDKVIESDYEDLISNNKADYKYCQELIERRNYFKGRHFLKKEFDIALRLVNITYNGDNTYFVLSVENMSNVDYDVNFIQFNKTARKVNKKATYQSIEIGVKDRYQEVKRIPAGSTAKAVYVFDKLSIDKNKEVNIELNELGGERNLKLVVSSDFINNPNK